MNKHYRKTKKKLVKNLVKKIVKSTTPTSTTPTSTTQSRLDNEKYKEVKRKITRKDVRRHEVERVDKIVKLIPQFIKFYNKFSNDELIALKYYKGYGSFFQTRLLTNETKPIEIQFPFTLFEEKDFRQYVYGYGNTIYPMLTSFDIKDAPKYIENNYRARINMLNNLDRIYNKPECPHLTGNEILFRGMTLPKSFKKYKAGDTFTFKNFISTTADRNIAELFSNADSLFILQNLKDIPFLYMPSNRIRETSALNYTKDLNNLNPYNDIAEYTLPRNLEFTIDKIENNFFSNINMAYSYQNKNSNFKKLNKLLSKKGIIDNHTTNDTTNDIIEQSIFPKLKIFYCTFTKWHPREPINYETIMSNSKVVLDTYALSTWSEPNKYFD